MENDVNMVNIRLYAKIRCTKIESSILINIIQSELKENAENLFKDDRISP